METSLRNRIWHELYQAKFHECYCGQILGRRLRLYKAITIFLITVSVIGVLSFDYQNAKITLIALIITAIFNLLSFIFQNILPSEREIVKLEEVVSFYFQYVNDIEKLWYLHEDNKISNDELLNRFYEIRNTALETEKKHSSVITRMKKSPLKKAETYTKNYINSIFRDDE